VKDTTDWLFIRHDASLVARIHITEFEVGADRHLHGNTGVHHRQYFFCHALLGSVVALQELVLFLMLLGWGFGAVVVAVDAIAS
jgi:hypothetical protein